MSEHLVLLPGWGFGPGAMAPLAEALGQLDDECRVDVVALPALDSLALGDWLDELDARLPNDTWLVGWSLGGMLAAELAARRGARCRGLVSMASNACFVRRETWLPAMPVEQFAAFEAGYRSDPALTLKRFALLCAQGASDARTMARQLQGIALHDQPLHSGLALLASLDVRAALASYQGPQHHLLAQHDALVPATAAAALQALVPHARVSCLDHLGHSLLLDDPQRVAQWFAPVLALENAIENTHD